MRNILERGEPSIMHTTRSSYGAPESESAAQALARVDTFITHHQACGDLVFQKRVDAAHITEDLLACIEAQALPSYSTSHRDRRTRRSNRLHPGANRVDQMTWDLALVRIPPIRILGWWRSPGRLAVSTSIEDDRAAFDLALSGGDRQKVGRSHHLE